MLLRKSTSLAGVTEQETRSLWRGAGQQRYLLRQDSMQSSALVQSETDSSHHPAVILSRNPPSFVKLPVLVLHQLEGN